MKRIEGLEAYIEKSNLKDTLGIPTAKKVVFRELAQGEYNMNYIFEHPISQKKMVFRVNTGSQMNIEHQIQYEYDALKFLRYSGRTPKPLYVDGSREFIDYGVLVMEFLEGRSLNYRTDLPLAAEILADIHKVPVSGYNGFISPLNPLKAILDECNMMFQAYDVSPLGNSKIKKQIKRMLAYGGKRLNAQGDYTGYRCCINTELNSGNFLINGYEKPNYLVDWEKPLLGTPIQDLGHFLAPTTTFWKTDIILEQREVDKFLQMYLESIEGEFYIEDLEEQLELFILITCLRGITWTSMAWVQYQDPKRLIYNQDTFRKLESYVNEDFLEKIEKQYFK
jgi:hypothetical protein